MIDHGKLNLLGVYIDAVDYETATSRIIDAAKTRTPLGVSALAVHGVMTGVMDNVHRHRLNQLELVVPDGQPVRWGLNMLHQVQLKQRVYGPDLMLKCCQVAADSGISIFLFGGQQDLLDDLKSRLLARIPNLNISGAIPSKFRRVSPVEKMELVSEICRSGAGITFVGIGCPRQEVWAYEFKNLLRMPVVAVGAAFNFHSGRLAQAPSWLQRAGLEWLFRMAREPSRLWKRYLILNPYYLFLLSCQWSGLRQFDPETTTQPNSEMLYG